MRNEKLGWCKPRKTCLACKDIGDTGLSFLVHTCGEKPQRAPRGASDTLSKDQP